MMRMLTHRVGQVSQLAELVTVLQSQDLECIRHNKALDFVIRRWHTLIGLEPL